MKILLVNKYLYPKGGDAISTLATGALLKEQGHEVFFWGMAHPKNPNYATTSYFIDNIDYGIEGGFKEKIKAAGKLLYSVEAKNKFEALIHLKQPDIVHLNNFAHQISPSILHVLKKYKIPSVMTMRDYKMICPSYSLFSNNAPCERCAEGRYYQAINQRCHKNSLVASTLVAAEMTLHHHILDIYAQISLFISPSRFLKEKIQAMGFKKEVTHLPNFVKVKEHEPSYDYDHKGKQIVYFGRLSAEKGLSTLIKAVKGLDVQLKIIGDGPQKPELENKIEKEGIKNIKLLGYRTGKDLHNEIKKSMFIALPSEWYENNPRSAIEAFALGKPVIGSRIGGIPELVIDKETGLLFTPGDSEDLAKKMQWLIANPGISQSMGKKARKFVEEKRNPESHYTALMQIYNQVITKWT